jgi:tRNA(Ile2) C34 agmatinyltransferase TiaS
MVDLSFDAKINLQSQRCDSCGHWTASENRYVWRCTRCLMHNLDSLRSDVARLERSNAALRGALTKSRRRGAIK